MWVPRVTWRQKAAIQRAVASLPAPIADRLYYALQRTVGGLRHVDPEDRFGPALEMARRLEAQGCSLVGGTVLEVGTGWRLNVPLALWLLGAQQRCQTGVASWPLRDVTPLAARFSAEVKRGALASRQRGNRRAPGNQYEPANICSVFVPYEAPVTASRAEASGKRVARS
jgi:hypothetical protein